MTIAMIGRDIYVRHTAGDGKSHVQCHRVWDAARLIASLQSAAAKEAARARADGKPAKHAAEQITEEQYIKERSK